MAISTMKTEIMPLTSLGSLISSCVCLEMKEEVDAMGVQPVLAVIIVDSAADVPEAKLSMCALVGIKTVVVRLDEKSSQEELHAAGAIICLVTLSLMCVYQ